MLTKFLTIRNSVVARVYAMQIVSALWFIYPLQTIMFGDRGGVDVAGIGLLIGAGTLLTIAFEIPTGVLADKISRKQSIVLSKVANMLQILAWLLWPSFTGYMIGIVFFAFGQALESGAIQAYLYTVLPKKQKKYFGKVWAQLNGLDLFVFAFAAILVTVVGVRYELVLALTLISAVSGLALSLSLPTDNLSVNNHDEKSDILKSAVHHIRQSPGLYRLLISGVIMVAMASYVNEYLALYYSQVGVDTRWLPALFGFGSILGGLTFWTLHLWEGFLNKHTILITLITMLIFAASLSGGVVTAALGYYVVLRLVRLLQVQFDSNVQHLSSEEARATISSIGSFIAKIIAGLVSIIIGLFAVNEQVLTPIRYSVFIGCAMYIIAQLIIRRRKST